MPSSAEFLEVLNSEFGKDFDVLMTHRIVEDLNFDSVDMVHLLVVIEELAASDLVEPSKLVGLSTVAECYEYLEQIAKHHNV